MASPSHVYFINVLRGGSWHSSGFSMRSTSAAKVRAKYLLQHPSVRPANIKAVRHSASRKVANPSASCPRQSPKFNAYQGRTVKYRKKSYEIEGCGIGRTAKRSIGKQEEGTYALRALKTGKKKYVAKRVIRDLAYHRGGKAILGMPKRKKAVKNPSKRGKLTGAAKAEFLARMAAGRRRAGR